MIIENIDKNQYIELVYKYNFDDYITYSLKGRNNFFSGESTICFQKNILFDFLDNLKNIKVGNTIMIKDSDTDSYISINKVDNLGHYKIIYQIGGSHQNCYCNLVLDTDSIGINIFFKMIVE